MASKIRKLFATSSGVKRAMVSELVLLIAGAMVGSAFAAQPGTYAAGAPAASTHLTSSSSTLKISKFSVLGTGTAGAGFLGTCFGETCNASAGDCFCEQFSGTTTAPILGRSTWTVDFTENDDDTTNTGNGGRCFPSEGELTITSAKGDIRAEISGPACQNFLGNASVTFVLQYGQAFQIDPVLSDGKTLGLNGGGSFSLSDSVNSAGFVTMTATGFSAK
ncbi:MAG TPA: hypothetical protein VKS22_14565 [Candidatus Binataceae bacterium]|nr:hypothetical protein [Candidatus Binataceae bacterium]